PTSNVRNPSRQSLGRRLAILVPIGLLVLYLLEGLMLVPASGGVEGLVRRTDFVSTLTGGAIISEGHGTQLYDLSVQHDAQNRVLAPYRVLGPNELLPYNHLPFEALFVSL